MEFGTYPALIGFEGKPLSLKDPMTHTETAERLGYQTFCANDHLVFSRPWLDGPKGLASVPLSRVAMRHS